MTKIETFRWRMWHVYLLIFITILLTGTFVRYGYRIQTAYSLDDRLYDYANKKVTVTSFQNVKIGNFNVLGVKFGNEKSLERSQLAVGRTYLAFQESRYKLSKNKKDSKNYDIIHYYQLGKDTGKGHTINVLGLAKKLGYNNPGSMDNTMYSDGGDEFVKFSSYDNKKVFYVNLRTQKATRTKPSKVSRYHGFAKPYRYLLSKDNLSIGYKYDPLTINSMPLIWTKERNFADYKDQDDNKYSDQSLKKRFSLIIVTTDSLNLDDAVKLQKELTPDKEDIYWYFTSTNTTTGRLEEVKSQKDYNLLVKESQN
ncbi:MULTISPECIES: hypothetical protein [Streptococcus]|uniref:hypothetical protein n=1 Tax=Streptococcus TaxID=1301 RepID=UPI0007E450F0|nr:MULTISPECIES: hypothetical protein [Streptococcus]MBK5070409.1 hypothetical protein [Streptococcus sp. 21.1]MBS6318756.1 hypothetical protein [Streptococcus salivarius]OHQ18573.1 hypothetical protein HMPREF2637_01870 [Streptococcus sp. HMSC065H07]